MENRDGGFPIVSLFQGEHISANLQQPDSIHNPGDTIGETLSETAASYGVMM